MNEIIDINPDHSETIDFLIYNDFIRSEKDITSLQIELEFDVESSSVTHHTGGTEHHSGSIDVHTATYCGITNTIKVAVPDVFIDEIYEVLER